VYGENFSIFGKYSIPKNKKDKNISKSQLKNSYNFSKKGILTEVYTRSILKISNKNQSKKSKNQSKNQSPKREKQPKVFCKCLIGI
jgi:hypothetical protein